MVGKEGASGAGAGGSYSSGMDGSKTITRRYPGRFTIYIMLPLPYVARVCSAPEKLTWRTILCASHDGNPSRLDIYAFNNVIKAKSIP